VVLQVQLEHQDCHGLQALVEQAEHQVLQVLQVLRARQV
jgi:hypothetical protein